ncbi:DUF1328 domain-containing protein [Urbifossiella limnaea]|uniref:Uncharacterized protein n=1 Tax=Urbifossiella limnaea TaxID=2528023 RepID=A0A517XYH8_9BACT|nr:hypothetical protein ETAA1_45150 [Urbifossiella limnaea]
MGLLKWALIFLVLAGLSALFGFGGMAEGFADVAKVLFGIFLLLVVVFAVLGVTAYKAVT